MSDGVKKHLINLVNALTNLSPSRNVLTQLILLLPRDRATIDRSFPEIISPEAKDILKSLGIEIEDTVKTKADGFAEAIHMHIHRIFDWLDDESVRSNLAVLADTHIDSIPNPYAEWVELVLKKLLERPNGKKIIEFLKMVADRGFFTVKREGYSRMATRPDWQLFLDEVKRKLKVSPAELEELLRLTVKGKSEFLGSKYTDKHTVRFKTEYYLLHTEYCLDLILSERSESYGLSHRQFDHRYRVRHRDTIRRILRCLYEGERGA